MATRKRYHHGDLRETLLDSVAYIIRERGIGFVSLREVARHAKVSHGAPAHHFKNKAGLLTAFAAQGYERLAQQVVDALKASGASDGPSQLETLGAGYVRFAVENPEQFSIMFRPSSTGNLGGTAASERLGSLRSPRRSEPPVDNEFVLAREAAYGVLMAILQRCVREGHVAPGELELVSVSAWSIVHGLAALWLSGRLAERVRDPDPHRLGRAVARLFVDSVLRRRSRPLRAR